MWTHIHLVSAKASACTCVCTGKSEKEMGKKNDQIAWCCRLTIQPQYQEGLHYKNNDAMVSGVVSTIFRVVYCCCWVFFCSLWLLSADVFEFYRRINDAMAAFAATTHATTVFLVSLLVLCRAQMFFLASYSCSQFCPYFCFCLNSILYVCMYVFTIGIYTPTHFLLYPKNTTRQIKTDFLSIETRTNKRLFTMHPFSFVLFSFSICGVIVLCATILLCIGIGSPLFLTKNWSWILYIILNGMNILTLLCTCS